MKIIYKQGDLLNCEENVIVHGCNSMGVMGSGVAALIRAKFPEAYREYKHCEKVYGLLLGSIQLVPTEDDKVIINAITQESYGRDNSVVYCDYEAIRKAFMSINYHVTALNLGSIAMPKIGAGLANGDWDIISSIIEEECVSVQPVVYVI